MNVFELFASLSLNQSAYEKGLADAGKKGSGFASNLGKTLATAGAAITAAAGTAVIAITKQAADAYKEAQQLTGGIEKLFGDASETIFKNSQQAYLTAGMSANQYMDTATQFAGALINELGQTTQAAEAVDQVMVTISDNINTFGSDAESVSNAFKGFAKQNYSMLDNLKLGYGGTKSEMERLIADANEWAKANGKAADLSIDSFSDVATAIQYIQEKQGIAGTTQAEALNTIEGSITAFKASWQNLLAGLADPNADVGALVENMVSMAGVAMQNLVPVITTALSGLGTAIAEIAPILIQQLPQLVEQLLPALLKATFTLAQAIIDVLPELLMSIVKLAGMLPGQIAAALQESYPGLWAWFTNLYENIKQIFTTISQTITSIWNGIKDTTNGIWSGLTSTLGGAWDGIRSTASSVWEAIKSAIVSPIETAKNLISNAISAIRNLFNFSWSLPHLALPHFYIGGRFSLNPPSVPYLGVSWYDKAYDDPYILNSPTIFGVANGKMLAGGESGPEAIVGTERLKDLVGEAVGEQLAALNISVVLDDGTLVGKLAPRMDRELGKLSLMNARGAY